MAQRNKTRIEEISTRKTREIALGDNHNPMSTWAVMLQYDRKFLRIFNDWLQRERKRRRK